MVKSRKSVMPWSMAKTIAKNAQDVFIDKEGVKKVAWKVMSFIEHNHKNHTLYEVVNKFLHFAPTLHPDYDDPTATDWIFVLNTLNFALWNSGTAKQWSISGQSGYSALCAAIKRAFYEEKPIWDPKYYTQMEEDEFKYIFRGDDSQIEIPLLNERFRILREVGQVLCDKYKGTFEECVKSCRGDPHKLLNLVIDEFESYRDEAQYGDVKISFHNKARILISDIWFISKTKKYKLNLEATTMPSTMFVDYRAPQILVYYKAIRYSNRLVTRFKEDNNPLEHGSREELEIRGCSLFAIKKVCEEVLKISRHFQIDIPILKTKLFVVPIAVDNFLWIHRQTHDKELMENVPFHYIKTIHY